MRERKRERKGRQRKGKEGGFKKLQAAQQSLHLAVGQDLWGGLKGESRYQGIRAW